MKTPDSKFWRARVMEDERVSFWPKSQNQANRKNQKAEESNSAPRLVQRAETQKTEKLD